MNEARFDLPLFVLIPRKTIKDKKWILNLNNYRNANFRLLAEVKILYSSKVKELAPKAKFDVAEITMTYYHGNNRRVDKSNPCSVIEKFMCDALTDLGYWEDDSSEHQPITHYVWGGVDKDNPRCEIVIKELAKIK